MRRFKYIRSSTVSQNNQYQKDSQFEMFMDVCSGTVPFNERENGSRLLEIIQEGDYLQTDSLNRLGRDSLNCLETLKILKLRKVNVELQNLGITSILDSGISNPAFEIVSSVLSVTSEQFRTNLLENQKKGIAIAKLNNKYKGRKKGTLIPRSVYLKKNEETVKIIKKHPPLSLRELAKLSGVSHVKIKKIKEML